MELQILKTLIEKSGLNQREFCQVCNIAEPRLSEWLKGVRNPKLSAILRIAEKLGYRIEINII